MTAFHVPETSTIPGYERPREKLLEGWWDARMHVRDKEKLRTFVATGDTDCLDGPTRRFVKAAWTKVQGEQGGASCG